MRIDEAEIVSYGEATKRYFNLTGRNFWLAFGPNEAGKSTFLEFVRNLLFDVPSGGGERFFSAVGATTLSGTATFRLDDGRTGRLERSWRLGETRRKSTFAATLRDAANAVETALDESAFLRLLNGANRRFFASYFGFSYEELAQGEKLLAESGLSELIYGIGLGGANLFNETKKSLKKELDAFFNADARASKPKINAAARRLNELDRARKKEAGAAREYAEATKERAAVANALDEIRERRRDCDERRRYWERAKNARKRFDEAAAAERESAEFLAASLWSAERLAAFPNDAAAERNELAAASERLERETVELNDVLETTEARLKRIELRPAFVAEGARIRRAFRRVEEIARERDALPLDEARLRRESEALARRAAEAGVEPERLADDGEDAATGGALERTLERARRGAEEERELAEKARTAATMRRDRLDEIAEIDRETERAERERREAFGDAERTADVADFERVAAAFGALRGEIERGAKDAAALDAEFREEERTARRLIESAFEGGKLAGSNDFDGDDGANVGDENRENGGNGGNNENGENGEADEDACRADRATALATVDAPLEATLEELERTSADAEKRRDAARAERRRLEAELARLDDRLNASIDWEASAEELTRRRRERDERWRSLKARCFEFDGDATREDFSAFSTNWENGEDGAEDSLAESVAAFERASTEADALADYRCENAKALAEWEAARDERTRKDAELAEIDERERAALETAETARRRAVALWRRAGLPLRADLSLAEGREWRALWRSWRSARRETERRADERRAEARRWAIELRETFETAARWLEPNDGAAERFADINEVDINNKGESGDFGVLEEVERTAATARRVERVLERARVRVERWLELERATEGRERRRLEAETKARRFERDERTAAEAEAELAARRRALCVESAGNWTIKKNEGNGENGGNEESGESVWALTAESFAELAAILEKRLAARSEARRVAESRRALEERRARLAEFDAEIGALAAALDVELDERTRPEDAVVDWAERAQEALGAEKDWRNETRNRDETADRIGAKKKAIAANEERRRALLETVGAADDDEFSRLAEAAEEARRLSERRAGAAELLRAVFEECDDAEFAKRLETLRDLQDDELETRLAEIAVEDAALADDAKRLEAQDVEIRAKIRAAEEKEGASRFSVERELALSELREAVELYAPRFLAFQALENSLRRCEEEKRPQILEDAEDIFRRLTAGRYSRIVANVGDGTFRAVQRDGVAKTPRELSSGTREQLYLALRLAHVRKYCENAESLPLIADDAFVNFDDVRGEEALRALADFAQDRQVVLLTCRESTRAAFERIVGADAVLSLTPRRFDD